MFSWELWKLSQSVSYFLQYFRFVEELNYMKGYMKVKIIESYFGQKLRFIFMMRDQDFHNGRSRLHLFFPGVTQGKANVGWIQDYIFSFLC